MEMKYKLNPDSKILLIKRENNKIGVYEKGNVVDVTDPIIDLTDKEGVFLEEISTDEKNKIKLVEIRHFVGQVYILNLINIDLLRLIKCNKQEFVSVVLPKKLSDNLYMFKDRNDGICLVDITGRVTNLEKGIRNSLEKRKINITNTSLHCFDSKKNPSIYELMIEFGNVDTLHIFLKFDKDIEFYNTFYSEMADGAEFVFSSSCDKDKFIKLFDFSVGLVRNSIINDIEYISNYEKKSIDERKKKVRKKAWNKIMKENDN